MTTRMIKRAVILAGGMGTRLREETEFKPKPMVEIGGMPILWHIMKNLHTQGIEEFIICLGYKGEYIKNFFLNYEAQISDIEINNSKSSPVYLKNNVHENWKIVLSDTGKDTMTGGRINRVRKYLHGEPFLCTYGDGLADIDLAALERFHQNQKTIATLTAVHPTTRFGTLEIDSSDTVREFSEKPPTDDWVNGGFFIFENQIFEYLHDESVLEQEPLKALTAISELSAFKHGSFWRPMDTYRESKELNDLWLTGTAPWVNWQ